MANIRNPQYGVEKDELTLTTQDPAAVLYGINPNNKFIPIKVTNDGSLVLGSSFTLEMSDLQIGAVELKNYDTDDRVYISPEHEILAQARLYDAAGNAITSTGGSLNTNITNGTLAVTQSGTWNVNNISGTISLPTGASTSANQTNGSQKTQLVDGLGNVIGATSNSLDVNITNALSLVLDEATSDVLIYGFDGASNQKIKTNVAGELQVGITNSTLAVTQSGTWNINNISGTVSLPTGASTEATLSAVKTQTDQLTFASTRLLVDGSGVTQPVSGTVTVGNATLAVTQSGAWSVGRTWNLSSGADSVAAVQSGTWNINNISGTVSLPTGASTEATLAAVKTQTDQLTFASTRLLVDGSGVTQPISAVSLPLPTGAATEATLATRASETTLSTRLADSTFTGRINTQGQKTMSASTPVVLASDQSFTHPTGLFIAQRTVNNQVFSVSTDLTMTTGGADNPLFLLRNPAGSGKTMYLKRATAGTIVNNVSVIAKIFGSPTITTNGTSITPKNNLVGSGTASVILATTLPTLSANGNELTSMVAPQNSALPAVIEDFGIVVPENTAVVLTGNPAGNNRAGAFSIQWVEV